MRLYNAAGDYEMVAGWWRQRRLLPVQPFLLPELGVVVEAYEPLAAGFCYFDVGGKVGCIDWISTNPNAHTRFLPEAVSHIVTYFEEIAAERGVHNLFTFSGKDTGLHHLMLKHGWQDPKSVPHIMLFRSLNTPCRSQQ